MRLLITTDTVGGVWTFTRELTEGVLEAGHAAMLISFGRDPSADQAAWVERTRSCWPDAFQFHASDLPLEWMQNNGSFYTEAASLLASFASHFRADLLHSNQLCFGAVRCGVPTLVTAHSDVRSWFESCRGEQPQSSPWIERYDDLVTRGLHVADLVVAPTAWMLRQAAAHFGPFRRTAVVPNGRDVPPNAEAGSRRVQAVTAGRLWDEGKGLGVLDSLAVPVPVLLAGDDVGPERNEPRTAPHVQYLGALPEQALLDLLCQSAMYIVTSVYEPFGLAPLEAALCGCALIARDLLSLREVWGDAALYFETSEDLARALDLLAKDDGLRSTLASAARARALALYSRAAMSVRYLDLYRDLIGRSSAAHLVELHVA